MNIKWLLTISFLFLVFLSKGQLEEHLVGYYPFENGKAEDFSDRGGNGKIYGDLQTVNGVNGEALYFNGGNHNIVFKKNINRFLRGKRDFSISFYFRSDDLEQNSSIMSKRNYCDGRRMFDIRLSQGNLKADLSERSNPRYRENVKTLVNDIAWHHYVYIRRGNSVQLFVDGVLQDMEQIRRIVPIDDRGYFTINGSPCRGRNRMENLRGAIDELKIFNIALSKNDVQYLSESNAISPNPSYQNPEEEIRRRDEASIKRNPSMDNRMQLIFGNYADADSKSSLVLEPKRFILTIKNPEGYQADELIYTGKYKIESGDIVLLAGEIVYKNEDDSSPQSIPYKEKIVGDLYENGVDLFAFETRMQLKK